MKNYVKPMIAEAELFTQEAIAVSIPKTRYNLGTGDATLETYLLKNNEVVSQMVGSRYDRTTL